MDNYLVITLVDGHPYLTSVKASSLIGAEMLCLMKVDAPTGVSALGFDAETIKTKFFSGLALKAETVSIKELKRIIKKQRKLMEGGDKQ